LVLDSESHYGGIVSDAMAGATMWFTMTYQCGRSDGKMPTFALRGSTINANVNQNIAIQKGQ
jgi:hypothetical protein